jgi:hypothetical protein
VHYIFLHIIYFFFQQTPGRRFTVTVSFIEICDEEIKDLLNTNQFKKKLVIVENPEVSFIEVHTG